MSLTWSEFQKDFTSNRSAAGSAIVFTSHIKTECEFGRYAIVAETFINFKNEALSPTIYNLIGIDSTNVFAGKTLDEAKEFAEKDYQDKVNKVLESRQDAKE
jgi:hypothetical protein